MCNFLVAVVIEFFPGMQHPYRSFCPSIRKSLDMQFVNSLTLSADSLSTYRSSEHLNDNHLKKSILYSGCALPLMHTLAKDMSLIQAQHVLHWTKAIYYLILSIIIIPEPPSQIYLVAPLLIPIS